ncbi:MAG TPA: endonuclease/exonuclease/phosphatase family protein [Verrucomicrobiota bacterium]|jgi:endonuclease/exonuclease/phosphatase family metal-dependent hydrolase|nr:endonuclease/exonuclease/phosphatase family protein [Verrucomicrobiota bacterium]HQL77467.1 endonuclease/exonuclease/phosphatase family protein [Verrucomicrobiota bacterium]
MQTRREFLMAAAAAGAARMIMPAGLAFAAGQAPRLRTITYNILRCRGYSVKPEAKPFLKAAEPQVPTRLALELALYEPDIVSFQEAPPREVVASIANQLRMKFAFFSGGWNGAVLSRHEIAGPQNCPLVSWQERPEDLFTRHWGRAVIRAPGGEIQFFSAHLHPSDASVRAREVAEMLKVMGPSLKTGERVVLQGDLNHRPNGPEYPRWVQAGLVDIFAKVKAAGTSDCSVTSVQPVGRIDYVWASAPLANRARECRILFERAFRTNPDDPLSVALSDHVPVMADFTS